MLNGRVKEIQYIKLDDSNTDAIIIKIRIESIYGITMKTVRLCYAPTSESLNKDDYPVSMLGVESYIYNIEDIIELLAEFGIDNKILNYDELDLSKVYELLREKILDKNVKIQDEYLDEDTYVKRYWIRKK